jgi:hypothetical protein
MMLLSRTRLHWLVTHKEQNLNQPPILLKSTAVNIDVFTLILLCNLVTCLRKVTSSFRLQKISSASFLLQERTILFLEQKVFSLYCKLYESDSKCKYLGTTITKRQSLIMTLEEYILEMLIIIQFQNCYYSMDFPRCLWPRWTTEQFCLLVWIWNMVSSYEWKT